MLKDMKNCIIDIKGMHCRSCELLVEDELLKVSGIKSVVVNQNKGTAKIEYEGEMDEEAVKQAIGCAGYCLGREDTPLVSKNIKDYRDLGIAVFVVMDLFLVARGLGLFNLSFANSGNFNSLPVVFLIGLTAGVSTCMALVGGLVLGASARFAEKHPNATPLQKFKPHLFFNLGRIISYIIFGAIIGYAGSFFQLSTSVLGILTISVGLVMLLLGAQLIEIFPILRGVTFTLPKSISRMLGIKEQSEKEYSHKNSMVAGAMTFFLPCGFTQAIQLYAISSGSPLTGALALGTFAVGTAPGLLGVGGLTSIIKGTAARLFFRTAGIVVILLALFNISNGYNLTGFNPESVLSFFGPPENVVAASGADPNVIFQNGIQVVNMTQDGSGYHPNKFTITRGIPVRWVINSTDSATCASTIVAQTLGVRKSLSSGENIVEFTPTETGQIRFTCIMGMFGGVFTVVDPSTSGPSTRVPANAPVVAPAGEQQTSAPPPSTGGGSCGKSGGCGCGGGAKKTQPVVPAEPSVQNQQGDVQVIKTTYTNNEDIRPNSFTLKAGIPARLEVEAKENGSGCMGSITIPGLTDKVDILTAGKTTVFEFTPKAGTYQITCAMGIPRGQIQVK